MGLCGAWGSATAGSGCVGLADEEKGERGGEDRAAPPSAAFGIKVKNERRRTSP